MRGRGALLCAALVLALPSCDGYRLVEPEGAFEGLYVYLQVTHDDSARYALIAFFGAGAETGPVRDEAIYVGGARVERSTTNSNGAAIYEWRETRPASDPRTGVLTVRGPELAGGGAPTFSLPLLSRAGAVAAPAAGQDLRLQVQGAAALLDPGVSAASFSLVLRSKCLPQEGTQYLFVSAETPVPAEVTVPRALLPEPLPSPLEACLQSLATPAPFDAPYPSAATVAAHLVWHLTP